MPLNLQGCFCAILTPLTAEGQVDIDSLKALAEKQIAAGINGLAPMGNAGEAPTLSQEEADLVLKTVIEVSAGRVPVICGTGSNNTAEAVMKAQHAKDLGADGVLVVNPYYNKPNQEGMRRHFGAIAEVGCPVILYNNPGRTGCQMTVDTIVNLRKEYPVIVGIKESTGSLEFATELMLKSDIIVMSGDDPLTLALMALGAKGGISVLSNVAPKKVLQITDSMAKGDVAAARAAHNAVFPVLKAIFAEVSPQAVKAALALQGTISTDMVRLPLVQCTDATKNGIKEILSLAE